MRVGVVYFDVGAEGGGLHTFAASIRSALEEEPASRHTFVHYAASGPAPPGVHRIPATRRERYRRRAIYCLRDVQDRAGAPRRGPATWFERSLARERIDLVWFATHYAEDCDLPFVFTVLDIEHARQPWFPEVAAAGEWERRELYFSRYIPKATRVIVANSAGADQVERHYRVERERILCLPHPTPAFALDSATGEAPPVPERFGIGHPYVLYPAQFWAHKNHGALLDALRLLDGYEAVMVGSDKGQLERMRRLADHLGVGARTHFLGFVATDELVALYRNAHALVYPSLFGPENLPPLEAFALGCPVVAADVPGAVEQLGDAALRVSPLDAGAIAAAVRRLEDDGVRAELTSRGRARAAERTAQAYVAGVLRFLDEFEPVRRLWG